MKKVEVSAGNFEKQLAITSVIHNLINKVDDETGGYSIHAYKLRNENFIALAEMGDVIVNYLFHLIFEYGCSWTILLLLDKIVKDKPTIPKEHAGKFYHQTVDWTTWYLTSEYYKNNDIYFNLVKE